MWRLAQKAPPIWSQQLLRTFSKAEWMPSGQQEKVGFKRLEQSARKCWQKSPSETTLKRCQTRSFSYNCDFITFSPDRKFIVTCNKYGSIELYQMSNCQLISTFAGQSEQISKIVISPDGRILASIGCKYQEIDDYYEYYASYETTTIRLYRISDCQHLHTFVGKNLTFSPDGQLIAVLYKNNTTIKLYQMPNGKPLATLDNSIYDIAFSPDGKILATSGNGTIRLYQIPNGKPLATFASEYDEKHHSVIFSSDSLTLVSNSRHYTEDDINTIKLI